MKATENFQKDAMTTDKKLRNEGEHQHEMDKRNVKESAKDPGPIPQSGKKNRPRKD